MAYSISGTVKKEEISLSVDLERFDKVEINGDSYPLNNPWSENGKLYNQDFTELQDTCVETGKLFQDPEFPPNDNSIYYKKKPSFEFEWKRASQIAKLPKFFVEGATRFDINQGYIGDCWFLAALANLTINKTLFYKVVPQNQSFSKSYAGIFHFQFWQYGKWIDVVVDDYLPVVTRDYRNSNGSVTEKGCLAYLASKSKDEFWVGLLEKAYAKLHGSYESLDGGIASDALVDFTGGCSVRYNLKDDLPLEDVLRMIKKTFKLYSFASSSINLNLEEEAEMDVGLVKGHAYSITGLLQDVHLMLSQKELGETTLIRLRNPWGNKEWNGDWSDESAKWKSIPESDKKRIGLVSEDDGEFWMNCDLC